VRIRGLHGADDQALLRTHAEAVERDPLAVELGPAREVVDGAPHVEGSPRDDLARVARSGSAGWPTPLVGLVVDREQHRAAAAHQVAEVPFSHAIDRREVDGAGRREVDDGLIRRLRVLRQEDPRGDALAAVGSREAHLLDAPALGAVVCRLQTSVEVERLVGELLRVDRERRVVRRACVREIPHDVLDLGEAGLRRRLLVDGAANAQDRASVHGVERVRAGIEVGRVAPGAAERVAARAVGVPGPLPHVSRHVHVAVGRVARLRADRPRPLVAEVAVAEDVGETREVRGPVPVVKRGQALALNSA
jgi:hypothetical protein